MTACVTCAVYRPTQQPRLPNNPHVCDSDRRRLAAELADIPTLHAQLRDHLEPGTGTGVRVSGTRTPPLPVRLDALNLLIAGPVGVTADPNLDQCGAIPPLVVLDLWVRDWIDVRDRAEHQPIPTVAVLAAWLAVRVEWACDQHPAVDEFAREISQTVRAIRGVIQSRHTGEPVGRCPMRLRDDSRCDTRLRADPYIDRIVCPRCGTEWDRRLQGWIRLRAEQAGWEMAA
jgi:hypothetical protein